MRRRNAPLPTIGDRADRGSPARSGVRRPADGGRGRRKDACRGRVTPGRLHRVYRGVYAVGHPRLSNEGRWMAATLACGEGAALSHRSAAELWALLPAASRPNRRHCPGHGRAAASGAGIRLHRSLVIDSRGYDHVRNGIAVTNPARTSADLRRVATPDEVRQGDPPGRGPGIADRRWSHRDRPHPQRARAALPAALPPSSPSDARGERPDWSFHRRLPVARPGADRRDRWVPLPSRPLGVRGRPRQGRGAETAGLRGRPLHATGRWWTKRRG